MYELKPCPFCGGKAEIEQTSIGTAMPNSVELSFRIICQKCGAKAPKGEGGIKINLTKNGSLNVWYDTRDQATAAWNMRAEDVR